MKNKILIPAVLLAVIGIVAAVYYTRKSQTTEPAVIQSAYHALRSELQSAQIKYKAKSAVGIIMNARNGEIVAEIGDVSQQNYEMGGLFSVFNTAIALENGIDSNREYSVSEPFKILDKDGKVIVTIRDNFKSSNPNMNVADILLHSSNVGSAQIALDLPKNAQAKFFERLNMNRALKLDSGQTIAPLFPKNWGQVERAVMSFGQGISVSPVQVLLGLNTIVNDGIYVKPTTYKYGKDKARGKRIISSENSGKIRQILGNISKATKANFPWINIGIKTSTAQKSTNGEIVTAVFATFPIDAPQFSMLIILDEPQVKPNTAAYNIVPTAGKIIDATAPMLFNSL